MVEAAWLKLPRAGEAGSPRAVYLNHTGVHVGGVTLEPGRGKLVGWYDRRVTLGFFREDVFEVNERCRGRG